MKKVLLDTNIILDLALKRDKFFEAASNIFTQIDNREIDAFISATTITDIYYILSKALNRETASSFLIDLLEIVGVLGVDSETVKSALNSEIIDFEDAIQCCCAFENAVDIIIARNISDFKNCKLQIVNPLKEPI